MGLPERAAIRCGPALSCDPGFCPSIAMSFIQHLLHLLIAALWKAASGQTKGLFSFPFSSFFLLFLLSSSENSKRLRYRSLLTKAKVVFYVMFHRRECCLFDVSHYQTVTLEQWNRRSERITGAKTQCVKWWARRMQMCKVQFRPEALHRSLQSGTPPYQIHQDPNKFRWDRDGQN